MIWIITLFIILVLLIVACETDSKTDKTEIVMNSKRKYKAKITILDKEKKEICSFTVSSDTEIITWQNVIERCENITEGEKYYRIVFKDEIRQIRKNEIGGFLLTMPSGATFFWEN